MSEFNADINISPIRWSKRLMNIKAKVYEPKKHGGIMWHRDIFVNLKKHTGSTIKKMFNILNLKSGCVTYGSHSHKCFACKKDPKVVQKEQSDFKRYTVKNEINDAAD